MARNGIIRKLRAYFSGRKEALAVYLYGSRAKGRAAASSDADVAVLLSVRAARRAFERRLEYAADLSSILGCEADVVILNEADPLLRFQVLATGTEALAADRETAGAFRERSLRAYWDFIPIMRIMNSSAVRRLKEYRWMRS